MIVVKSDHVLLLGFCVQVLLAVGVGVSVFLDMDGRYVRLRSLTFRKRMLT